jgi:hypothetical protein
MLPFKGMIKNLNDLKNGGIDIILEVAIKGKRDFITGLNTKGQLFNGIDSRGEKISPAYASRTISIKKSKGQPYNRVTLKDKGNFYRETDIDTGKNDFVIINYNEQYPYLSEKYGKDLLGLTPLNKAFLASVLKPELIKLIKQKI